MKTVMILPPTSLAGMSALITAAMWAPYTHNFSIFLDMQANVVELEDRRYLVEHQIPGREGGILQDVGSACARLTLSGKWIYENRPDNDLLDIVPVLRTMNISWNWLRVQTMRLIARMRAPLIIASDIMTSSVMIESLKFRQVGGQPNVFNYIITLREWNPALSVLGIAGTLTNVVPSIIDAGEVGR